MSNFESKSKKRIPENKKEISEEKIILVNEIAVKMNEKERVRKQEIRRIKDKTII